jgi:putative RecB family exonuclease
VTLDTKALYAEAFREAVEDEQRFTSVPPDDWYRSGRASKQWPRKEGPEWWLENGPVFVDAYVHWRRKYKMRIWETPQGLPGIELDIRTPSLSSVKGMPEGLPALRAIIDRVFVDGDGQPVVVDLKSGKMMSKRQLGFYKVALELVFGLEIVYGAFFDARKGGMTELHDLRYYTPEVVAGIVRDYEAVRKTGIRTAAPSNMCSSCTVRDYCAEQRGQKADLIPGF